MKVTSRLRDTITSICSLFRSCRIGIILLVLCEFVFSHEVIFVSVYFEGIAFCDNTKGFKYRNNFVKVNYWVSLGRMFELSSDLFQFSLNLYDRNFVVTWWLDYVIDYILGTILILVSNYNSSINDVLQLFVFKVPFERFCISGVTRFKFLSRPRVRYTESRHFVSPSTAWFVLA